MKNKMREAIMEYAKKASLIPNWWSKNELDKYSDEFKSLYIDKSIYFIERDGKTDLSKYKEEVGSLLPDDIGDYINLFWHPYIKGFYKIDECIIIFSVIKYNNENDNDVLFHKHGIIDMANNWRTLSGGDIKRYIPIGWTEYSGGYILYDIKTGKIYEEDFDQEGIPSEEPLANSFKELILNLSLSPKRSDKI